MRITYGKLIRDRIPEIMDAEGVRYEVVELDDAGFHAALLAKVLEEAEEIADLYEVLDALLASEGIAASTVADVRRRRREERGGFERRFELMWTER